ncbi:MAG: hypothetical protein CMD83_01905 [Gammaproteobacteria bacterium]|nr:hypothetical protein [Gammaproteobacteria bacterium]
MARPLRIAAVGECCLDHYTGEQTPRLGGITYNFALHAARAFENAEIHLISSVGHDARDAFVGELDAAGVHHDLAAAERTPSLGIRLDDAGERTFFDYDPGGLLDWEPTASQRETIESADYVVLTRYHEIASLFERLVRLPTRGQRVVDFADISNAQSAELPRIVADHGLADVCIFGLAPHETAARTWLTSLARDHAGLFVITLASEGAVAVEQSTTTHQPAFPVAEVVDTTGAGDCFAAHFLSRWCTEGDVGQALTDGCFAASQIIQRRGAS